MRFAKYFFSVVLLAAGAIAPTQVVAASQVAVHFQGTFHMGASPAPAGVAVTVIVARSINDVTNCGTGSVSGNGQYRVDVQATPPCVNSATSRNNGPYIFVADGENIGGCGCLPSLESPSSLGHTMQIDLHGTPISLSAGGTTAGGALPMPAIRLWGSLSLAGVPAQTGTVVNATTSGTQADCGLGTVIDNSGTYWLDIPATSGCASSRAGGSPGNYILIVNGENVGGCGCPPSLDSPASLGHTLSIDLHGQLAPAAQSGTRLNGSVATTGAPQTDSPPPAPEPLAVLLQTLPAECGTDTCAPAARALAACLNGTDSACGTAVSEAGPCLADSTASTASRTFCLGVLDALGSLGTGACAAPLLLVTVACPPADIPDQQQPSPVAPQPQPEPPAEPQPDPLPVPLPVPGPTRTSDEQNRCNYRGGVLTYVPGSQQVGIDHILNGHRRTAAIRGRVGIPQGIFIADQWPPIQALLDAANADPNTALAWIPEGGVCVLDYRFADVIGWDNPPTTTGQPTPCVHIVIINHRRPRWWSPQRREVGVVGHDPPLLDIGGWALRRLRQLPVDGELRYDCSRSGPFLEFARHKDRVRITSSTSQVSVHVDYAALLEAWEAFAAQVRGFLAPFDGGAALLEDADYVPSVAPRSLYVIPESSPYIRFELDGPSTLVHYSSTDSVGEIGFDQLHSAWKTFAEDVRSSLLERIPALASHPDWPR